MGPANRLAFLGPELVGESPVFLLPLGHRDPTVFITPQAPSLFLAQRPNDTMGLAAVLSLSRTPQETRELAARKPPQEGEGEEDVNDFARRKPMPATKPAAPLKPQVDSQSR